MNKFKLIKPFIASIMIATNLTSCSPKMNCDVAEEHVHLYMDEENGLSRFIDSERQTVKGLSWTNQYIGKSSLIKTIVDNNLYIVSDNITYLERTISQYKPKREAFIYDYVDGTYYDYGYSYKYNFNTGEYEYCYGYGPITGYHWEYVWKEIALDEYTTDKIRDINYQFKFYKIEDDGTLSYKYFNSLENVEEGYNYFKDDLVNEIVSKAYYIEKQKINTK